MCKQGFPLTCRKRAMERDSLKANYGAYAELDSGNP